VAKQSVTARMRKAARLLAEGLSPAQVAGQVGCAEELVCRWMQTREVKAEYSRYLRLEQAHAVAKAQRLLIQQLDSEEGNGKLAQQAATILADRYGESVMNEGQRELVIRFSDDAPELGTPDPADVEEIQDA